MHKSLKMVLHYNDVIFPCYRKQRHFERDVWCLSMTYVAIEKLWDYSHLSSVFPDMIHADLILRCLQMALTFFNHTVSVVLEKVFCICVGDQTNRSKVKKETLEC